MLASARPAPRTQERWEFALVTDRAGFDALEEDWNELFSRSGRGTQAFQAFNWNWHWCNHFLTGEEEPETSLAIVTARRAGRLVMVWPLVEERVAGLRQLAWMGEPVSQYGDVLIEDEGATELLRAAWAYIRSELEPDLVRLNKVRDDAAVATVLQEFGGVLVQRLEAPYLDLSSAPDFATYEQRYSPRSRRNRRRLFRRFAERGEARFERCPEGAQASALAIDAIDLKRVWLKERGLVSPALADPRMARFFADVADGRERSAGCQVSALTSDGEPAAIEITLTCKKRTLMHVIVFNLKHEKAGAGVLLLEDTIARAYGDGSEIFDLLAPADSYKRDWADGLAGVCDWALPLTLKGWVYTRIYLGFARPAVKTTLAALPMPVRRFVAGRYAG